MGFHSIAANLECRCITRSWNTIGFTLNRIYFGAFDDGMQMSWRYSNRGRYSTSYSIGPWIVRSYNDGTLAYRPAEFERGSMALSVRREVSDVLKKYYTLVDAVLGDRDYMIRVYRRKAVNPYIIDMAKCQEDFSQYLITKYNPIPEGAYV